MCCVTCDRNFYYHTGPQILCDRPWSIPNPYIFEFIYFSQQLYQVSAIIIITVIIIIILRQSFSV